MKNLILIITITLIFSSCKKDTVSDEPEVFDPSELLESLQMPAGLNAEALRIYTDLMGYDFSFGIIDNPNFESSTSPETEVILSGQSPSDLTLSLNNINYTPNANGGWLQQGSVFKNYFDKNVEVKLQSSGSIHTQNVHVPKQLLVEPIIHNGNGLSRVSSQFNWTPDPANTSEVIAIIYYLYQNDSFGEPTQLFDGEVIITEDDGSYDMATHMSNLQAEKIYIRFVRGTTVSTLFNNKKVVFNICSMDHHEYTID